jgi:glycosyltransferase involved in cell wall biosynthesis
VKVLQANRFFSNRGGAETVMFQTIGLLERHGHEVIPFSMQDPENVPSAYSSYFAENVNLKRKPSPLLALDPRRWLLGGRAIYSPDAKQRMNDLILAVRPDVAHLHNIYHQLSPSVLRPLSQHGVPTVLTLHDYKLVCPNSTLFTAGSICERCVGHRYYNAVSRGCVHGSRLKSTVCAADSYGKYVDLYTAPSAFMKRKMTELGLDGDRIVHLANPINLHDYEGDALPGSYIMFAGRLEQTKGVETLLDAVAGSALARGVELRIAGEGSRRVALEKYARSRGLHNVRFLGWLAQDELADLRRGAMFAVVPSRWYEVFGLAVVEAQAFGKAVIGARIGGIPELIEEGRTGLLFEPGDATDLRLKIEYLLSDPDRTAQMGACARQLLEHRYTEERQYRMLMDVYELAREMRDARLRLNVDGKGAER